jgi:ABC-type sugar transport system ATPase subunit
MLTATFGHAFAFVDRGAERRVLAPEVARLRLKAASLEARAESLSGGNQQKVALLRCLAARPRLLLLDDPARGVDLGAKADLFARLHEAARGGTSTLFYSSDLTELVEHADRVLVLFRGAIVATLERGEIATERLLSLVMGASA